MNPSTPLPPRGSSHQRPSGLSGDRWKEYLHAKLKEGRKKFQASASLFWDWRTDVKSSPRPPKESR